MNEENTAFYLNNFFGYGHWQSNFWFVGMEEGGGNNWNLVVNKINAFCVNGHSHISLVDNYEFQINAVGHPWNEESLKFLGPRPGGQAVRLQSYWSKKIKILLHIHGLNSDKEAIRHYQANSWGRIHIEEMQHAVIELLPLPSPNTNTWFYNEWTNHFTREHCPPLSNRNLYRDLVINARIDLLREKINHFHPKLIVFSGATNDIYYNQISGIDSWENLNLNGFRCSFGMSEETLYVKASSPNARGMNNQYWISVANEISLRLQGH